MSTKRTGSTLRHLLESERVRSTLRDGVKWYAATDVVGALSESQLPSEYWHDLKQREPQLAALAESADLPSRETGLPETVDVVHTTGVLRLVQSIPSAKADRIKMFLAQQATE